MTTAATDHSNDSILIIGGGPVGMALSIALAKYNIKTVVIEKRSTPTPVHESRAIVWMPKGIEFLKWLGLLDAFKQQAIKRYVHRFTIHGEILIDLDLGLANSEFGYSLNLPQYYTEHLFEEEIKKRPDCITLMRGWELVDCKQGGTSVLATIQNDYTQSLEILSGRFLIGCDGAKSKTRELMGIELDWNDYGTFSAVADIEAQIPGENPAISWIELNARRPIGLFGFHPGKWRITYRVNQSETREEAATEAFVSKLIETQFPQIDQYNILWASCFRLGQGQSKQYFNDRMVLAGDAAHPMGPSAGAGMMVGMLGVWRLAFRLSKIIKETDTDTIQNVLSAYEQDQRKGAATIQKANAATFAQIAVTGRFKGWLRNNMLRLLSRFRFIQRKIVVAETLTGQKVHYED